MSTNVTIFSLIRQGLAHATFKDSETRNVVNAAIDSLETSDNDLPGRSIEEHPDVEDACTDLIQHLSDLLGNPITTKAEDDNAIVEEDDDFDDPIETE